MKLGGKSHCSRELLEKARLPFNLFLLISPFTKFTLDTLFFFHYLPIFLFLFATFIDVLLSFWSRDVGAVLGSIFAIFSFCLAIRIPFVGIS